MKAHVAKTAVFAMILAAIAVVGPAFAGQAQAEREQALRQIADPESRIGWQVRAPLETGSLPAGEKHMGSEIGSSGGFPTVEVGGTVYRIGIDTY